MKSTEKYVEIMEKLTGISVDTQVTFKESTYKVAGINTDEIEAKVTLTSEGKEDIVLTLKSLIESEEYVVEAKCKEEMDGEGDGEEGEDDKKKKEDGEEEMGEADGEGDGEGCDDGEGEDGGEMEEKKK